MLVALKGKAWSVDSILNITSFIRRDGARHQLHICEHIQLQSITSASMVIGFTLPRL